MIMQDCIAESYTRPSIGIDIRNLRRRFFVWSHTILLQHLIRSNKNLWLILMSNFLTWVASLLFQTQYRVDEVIMITHERTGADKISAPWWDPTSKVYRSITIRDEIFVDLCSILWNTNWKEVLKFKGRNLHPLPVPPTDRDRRNYGNVTDHDRRF